MKFCSSCINLNEEGAHFCDECGASDFARTIIVGRSSDANLIINDPSVSQKHLAAAQIGHEVAVRDLDSTNGTYLGQRGNKITGSIRVNARDTLILGAYTLPVAEISRFFQAPSQAAGSSSGVSNAKPPSANQSKTSYLVGRDPEADFTADIPTVSWQHLQITKVANGWEVTDLQSSNGTFINSSASRLDRPTLVNLQDVLILGSYRLPLKLLIENLEQSNANTSKASITLHPQKPIIIGRSDQCDVLLSHPQVSGRHAKLTLLDSGRLLVEDLGSLNGTYVNGKKIVRQEVDTNSQISLGFISIDINRSNKVAANFSQNSVRLDAMGISRSTIHRSTGENLTLLENVDLSIYPSELVALMGPSGAGKTTLLQILCGEEAPTSGELLLNGENLLENFDRYRSAIGYVPQDDILHKDLTVHEAFYFSARMRLPPDTTTAEIEQRITQTLKELNLEERRDDLIGSVENKVLSGGQRKRVNLGVELVSDPVLLFLDEPTSGLSSSDTADIITVLRALADQGKTIILTIHQPSTEVYNKMNYVSLLAKGGQLAFFGPPNPDSFEYFQSPNKTPEEVIANLDKKAPKELAQSYRKSDLFSKYIKQRQPDRTKQSKAMGQGPHNSTTYPLAQFFILLHRCWLIKKRDQKNLLFLFLLPLAIGLLIGNLSENKPEFSGPLFIMVLATIFSGLLNACRELVSERAIFRRERRVNLQIMPYLLSKIVLLWAIGIIQSLILIFVMRSIIPLNASITEMFVVLTATSLAATIVGLLISALVKAETEAMVISAFVLIAQLVLGGFAFPLDEDWKKGLSSPLISRWSTEALFDAEMRGMDSLESSTVFKKVAFEAKGLQPDEFGKDMFLIFCISLASLMATTFVLTSRTQNKKNK